MTYRPRIRRQNRWKKAWTELSKEAVWLAIVQRDVLLQQVRHRRHPERVRREMARKARRLQRRFIIRQTSIPVMAFLVSVLVLRFAVRKRGPSVIPAAWT